MKFLVDANLPPALATWIAEHGREARHVDEVFAPPSLDGAVVAYARGGGWVIVSKDADFHDLTNHQPGPQIVWIRCGNLKLKPFRAWFEARAMEMFELLDAGERLIELR